MDDRERRERTRVTLERSTAGHEPDPSALLEAVPGMLAEARRRRQAQAHFEASDWLSEIAGLGSRWIPRLSLATGALASITLALLLRDLLGGGSNPIGLLGGDPLVWVDALLGVSAGGPGA